MELLILCDDDKIFNIYYIFKVLKNFKIQK